MVSDRKLLQAIKAAREGELDADGLVLTLPNGNYHVIAAIPASRCGYFNVNGERLAADGPYAPLHFAHPVKGKLLEPVKARKSNC